MADTRERFIDAATRAFAERGFYGTSIANIAESLPFTKQALLHHFGSKEKLYAEVLTRISERLMRDLAAAGTETSDASERFENVFVNILRASLENSDDTRLLMRELLDNKRRAESARTWYLAAFLDTLTDLARDALGDGAPARSLALVYQLLGAINYFVVSRPTLAQMLGAKTFDELSTAYEHELRSLITSRLGVADEP
ncbi:MAG: TetR/AcrR family transcriptional regulator [Pseudomonadota bacterium]